VGCQYASVCIFYLDRSRLSMAWPWVVLLLLLLVGRLVMAPRARRRKVHLLRAVVRTTCGLLVMARSAANGWSVVLLRVPVLLLMLLRQMMGSVVLVWRGPSIAPRSVSSSISPSRCALLLLLLLEVSRERLLLVMLLGQLLLCEVLLLLEGQQMMRTGACKEEFLRRGCGR
jgi:hypothetical protein